MARKVIIDCDPGIGDAVALCLGLFDPRLEVVAVTACEGTVSADQANRNVQALVEHLDPPRLARLGAAHSAAGPPLSQSPRLNGPDGLGNAGLAVSQLHRPHPSAKLIADEVRVGSNDVTIITLGPLTNLATALQRDPAIAESIDRVIMLGGSLTGVGDVTAAAEFNMYYDSVSARTVFHSATTKMLIPLETAHQVVFSLDLLDRLPAPETRAGALLHRMIPFAFRSYRHEQGLERIHLDGAVALLAALEPTLFETIDLAGDVETTGSITTGATIFDRRPRRATRPNMEVATAVDAAAAAESIVAGMRNAGEQTA